MQRRNFPTWTGIGGPALAGYLALTMAGVVSAAPETQNVLSAIDVQTVGDKRVVTIDSQEAPTFSVFRLKAPERLLVDVNHGVAPESMAYRAINDDPWVRYVSAHNFQDGRAQVARVEFGLTGPNVEYDVRAEGRRIVVELRGPKALLKDANPGEDAAPSASALSSEPAFLGKLSLQSKDGELILSAPVAKGDLLPEHVRIERLAKPARLLVVLEGASAKPKWQRLKVGALGIRRARLGSKPDGVHLVLDLISGQPVPEIEATAADGYLGVVVRKAQPKAIETPLADATQPAPVAAEPAPQVELEAQPVVTAKVGDHTEIKVATAESDLPKLGPAPMADVPQSEIKTVRFEPKEGFVRLTVEVDEASQILKDNVSSKRLPVLRIRNAKLPEALVRTLDTQAVAGQVVRAVSTYSHGDDVMIAASIGQGTEHRYWRKGNRLMWDFRARAEVESVGYPAEATLSAGTGHAEELGEVLSGQKRSSYRGRRISLDLKDADIVNVIRLLADVSKLNIVTADDVGGRVTMKLRNVPWDQAFDIILQSKQLDKIRVGNIIRVAPIAVLEREEQLRLARKEAGERLENLSVRLIPVNYADAGGLMGQVSSLLSPRGRIQSDNRTNVLIIEDIQDVLIKAERLVRTLDTQTPQVLIEARVVEAGTSFQRSLGIQWGGTFLFAPQFGNETGLSFPNSIRIAGGSDQGAGTPTDGVLPTNGFAINLPGGGGAGSGGAIGFVFGSAGGSALLSLRLAASESEGKTRIVSAPKIVTMDNEQATISTGEQVPITVVTANGPTTRFIEATLSLAVTPQVTSDGSIRLQLTVSKNEISGRQDSLGVPGILTRAATTQMLVKDGDTAVVGGIYRRTATLSKNMLPWVGRIPVLGWLFKNSNVQDAREELLIFTSPRIINRSESSVQAN